jgi:ubiquitin thioesterase protein OTUB1
LTSAWIQTHPNDFAPFILGQDIKQYCASEIEPSICELDNVGLNALVEALVKPAGLALEVTYLDRSQGDEMNVYRYEPEALPSNSVPTIRLLYRPYVIDQ